jgi:adenylate kinase family enzyme
VDELGWQQCVTRLAASRRILILGSSGSGKTYLAIRLARLLGLELIHLDANFWKPGWVPTPRDKWRTTVSSLVQRPAWIMDGTYESSLDLRIPASDLIIYIERGRLACLWGVARRKLVYWRGNRPDAPSGEPLDRAFIRYIWRFPTITRETVFARLREYGRADETIILNGPGGVKRLLRQMSDRNLSAERSRPAEGNTHASNRS